MSRYLVLLLIFLLPTQIGKHFFFNFSYLNGIRVDYLAPTIYITDVIVFLLLIFNLKTVFNFFKNRKILIILILLFINSLVSLSFFISIYRCAKIIELLIIIAVIKKNKPHEKILLITLLISGMVQLILATFQLINKHSLQGIFYFLGERLLSLSTPGVAKAALGGVEILRPYGTFSHPNSLAGFYLLIYFYVLTNNKFSKYLLLKYLFLLIFSLLILFSFSKIAIIVYLVLTTAYYLLTTKNKCRLCFVAKILIPFIVAFVFIRAQTDPLTVQKRFELINNSLKIIFNYPLLGIGIGNYLLAQGKFASKYYNFINQPVHNIFLLTMAELGIIIFGLVLILLFPMLKKLWRRKYLYLILVVVITGLFDHYWLTLQQNFLLLGVVAGLLI